LKFNAAHYKYLVRYKQIYFAYNNHLFLAFLTFNFEIKEELMSCFNSDLVHVDSYYRQVNGLPQYVCEHERSRPNIK